MPFVRSPFITARCSLATRGAMLIVVLMLPSMLDLQVAELRAQSGSGSKLPGKIYALRSQILPTRHSAKPAYVVQRAARPPVLDGKLDEWRETPAIVLDNSDDVRGGTWTGKDDFSGALRMMWDDGQLYFALEVRDNVVNTPKPTQMGWTNDCCQMIFDSLLNGHETSLDERDLSYCASRDPAGPMFCAYRVSGGGEAESRLPDTTIRFSSHSGGYIYEWSLPWERLAPVSPWILGRCGFSFTINDNDGADFKGAMAWTQGAIYGLNALKLGQIIFEGAQGHRDAVLELPAEFRSASPYGEHRSSWLELPGTGSFQAARLVLYSTKPTVLKAALKVYAPGAKEPLAHGEVAGRVKAGRHVVCAWDLSGLPKGNYEIEYENSLVPSATGARIFYRQLEDPPLALVHPSWPRGYRVRYTLRVDGDATDQSPTTILASVPTGGWLKPDYGDLVLKTVAGKEIPAIVLSHDPLGDTLIQFRRSGDDQWYFLYASNPKAPPRDTELFAKIDRLKKASQKAALTKMAGARVSAERSAKLRDLRAIIDREQATLDGAIKELSDWDKLLPERIAAAEAAKKLVPPAQDTATKADAAHAPFKKVADEKTTLAAPLIRAADEARRNAQDAAAAHDQSFKAVEAARQAIVQADAAVAASQAAVGKAHAESQTAKDAAQRALTDAQEARKRVAPLKDAAKATAEREAAEKEKVAASSAQAATAKATAADQALQAAQAATAAATKARADLAAAEKVPPAALVKKTETARIAAEADKPAQQASDIAQQARLAAAPSAAVKAQADAMLAQLQAAAQAADLAVTQARERIVAVKALKAGAEKVLAENRPNLPSTQQAAEAARNTADAARQESVTKEKAYFDFANVSDPRLFKEGLTVEYRQWSGDKLGSWAEVVDGIAKSDNILGSSVVGEVVQNVNPFRRSDARNFAASYRGYLRVDKPGVYSFCVNADDAAFLFINGYKVYSRTGSNPPFAGSVKLYSIGSDILLEAGVHPFDVHHIVGNTPGARGLCSLLWLAPGSKKWEFVPREAYSPAMLARPVAIDAFDGRQIAAFDMAMDDTLSSDGVSLYLARLEAQGQITDAGKLQWQIGRLSRTGRSLRHLFFREGDYEVALQSHAAIPPFRRRCHVWTPPVPTSPLALTQAVRVLRTIDVRKLEPAELNDAYHFLSICQQPDRWPVMEKLCRHLLAQPKLDLKYRASLYASLMRSMAEQGRGQKALELLDDAVAEVAQVPTLRASLMLEAANIDRDLLRDFDAADGLYAQIIDQQRRLRHPIVRQAAVAWGDMFVEGDDLARAGEAFHLARGLGSVGVLGQADDDPVKRGALLRVAEQQLRAGNVRQTRRMLQKIEDEFPEQKLEGLYRFLRGEAERNAGRYERAIRNYEVVLELPQWASYRPSALFGIADSYLRMGDVQKSLDWLSDLAEEFPDFLKQKHLANYVKDAESRLAPANVGARGSAPDATGQDASSPSGLFVATGTGFEPGEIGPTSLPASWSRLPALGISGACTVGGFGAATVPAPRLREVSPQGALWVELWYRTTLAHPIGGPTTLSFTAAVNSDRGEKMGEASTFGLPTFGRWHKTAFRLPNPGTREADVTLYASTSHGHLEIDDLRVWHVTDQQDDALRTFIEGADPQ